MAEFNRQGMVTRNISLRNFTDYEIPPVPSLNQVIG